MNNKFKNTTLLLGLVWIVCLFGTNSCNKDEYNTDQMSGGKITLKVYGPRPALRGSEIRFVGTNMDKVTGVVFPVSGEVTNFTKKEKTEIRVLVPNNAGYGRLVLKTPEGDITTDTEMTYVEPIEITSITETPVKAGQEFVIKGKFLYMITQVIFQEGAKVDVAEGNISVDSSDPLGLSYIIKVLVPLTARSGQIILSNVKYDSEGNEIGIPIEVGSGSLHANIILPSITSFSPETIKAGNVLTITGKDFELVESIIFGGGKEAVSFTVNAAKTSITVTVPADAQDGNVVLIAKSGVESPSPKELIMLVPTISSISPNPVKNEAILTVTGTDLDLVDKVTFGGGKVGTIQEGRTATSLQIAVPIDAKEGAVTFTTLAGKDVLSAALTLVKPKVTGYASSTVSAGSDVTMLGTNLDLVVSIAFPGKLVVEAKDFKTQASTSLTVTIPPTAQAGDVILTMVNGDEIVCPPFTIIAPVFAFIPKLPDWEIVAGELMTVEIVNEDKLTGVEVGGRTTQFIVKGTTLYVLIPSAANGATQLKLVSSNGEVTYTIPVSGKGVIETTVWEGIYDMFANPWSATAIPNAGFANARPGDRLRVYFTSLGADAEIQLFYGDWSGQFAGSKLTAGTAFYDVVLTAEMLQHIMNPDGWAAGLAIQMQGNECIVYKLAVRAGLEPNETVLFDTPLVLSGWNNRSIPKATFGTPAPGTILRLYLSNVGSGNQIQIFPGDWGAQLVTVHPFYSGESLKIPEGGPLFIDAVLSAEMIQRILNPSWGSDGMIIQGDDVTINKLTLLYY